MKTEIHNLSDDDLMAGAARGEAACLEELVRRWQEPVLRFLRRMLGDPAEAEDLAQETLVRVIRSADAYQPRGRFRSWLFRIAGNLARNEIRRRKLRRFLSLDALAETVFGSGREPGRQPAIPSSPGGPGRNPGLDLEAAELQDALQRAVLKLPERQRQVLILRRLEGLTQREAAEALEVTESVVESLLWRASRNLKRRMKPYLASD
ncbi:MAG: sigma-70 family RNA polymerase sigma factor [Candidatus Eisenbacteria bacterium]|nr:sigma-70 family RNA polymerase sigma factor [Candidatus Eisenbacteria bacterium]